MGLDIGDFALANMNPTCKLGEGQVDDGVLAPPLEGAQQVGKLNFTQSRPYHGARTLTERRLPIQFQVWHLETARNVQIGEEICKRGFRKPP